MAATLYTAPKEVTKPEFRSFQKDGEFNIDGYHKAQDAYIAAVVAWCKANSRSKNDLVGEVFRYPVADGYAQYVVFETKPLRLVHLDVGDGWHIPDVVRRGLTLADIKADKARRDAWAKLTAKKTA